MEVVERLLLAPLPLTMGNGASGNDHTTPQMPQSVLRRGTLPFARWSMDSRYYCWGAHASSVSVRPSWSGVNRVSRSRFVGSSVAKLADESSVNGHEWVRRDPHASSRQAVES